MLPVLVVHPDLVGHTGGGALLVFAWASGGWVLWGWLGRHASVAGAAGGLGALLVADALYVLTFRGVTSFLAPSLVAAGTGTVPRWALIPVGLAMALVAALRLSTSGRRAVVRRRLYVAALSAGSVPPTAPARHPGPSSVRALSVRVASGREEVAA